MTELKPSMILRYFTNEIGKHYTAIVLKDQKILSVKVGGEKDKTVYDSLIHWLATLPGEVTVSNLDIQEKEYIPKLHHSLKKDTITLRDIAPNYDLLRFLLTYEAYSLKNSLVSAENKYKMTTRTYVQDSEGNLHPVKYNRYLQKLYSEHHDRIGSSLEELGFPKNANIYVNVPGTYYEKRYREWSFDKVKLPFTINDYEAFYDAKIAFMVSPILNYVWADDSNNKYYHSLIYDFLKSQGYHIFTQFFRITYNDSIFYNKLYKYLDANILVVQPSFNNLIVHNYRPLSFVNIPFRKSDENIIEELKSIL
jgi:hypothetical protein